MINKEKEDLKILLSTGKITTLVYLNKLGGLELPYPKKWTEEEKRTGNTPRVRAYCRNHGL